ncbi:MAG: hypothetical protein K8R92_09630 [Planctomycetes bacterium]|nr:hypothetical protein [Planctomycetota bacterium]
MVTRSSSINPFSRKPQVWLGALLAAVVPIGAVTWKSWRSSTTAAPHSEAAAKVAPKISPSAADQTNAASTPTASVGGIQAWFEGAANPFLTTAQAKDRRNKEALAKVEAALKGRSDVEEVRILAEESAEKNPKNARKPAAVVSIRTRGGSLPLELADTAGALVAAALPTLVAEDVEVIDERNGMRVRARSQDASEWMVARTALEIAAACEQQESTADLVRGATNEPPAGALPAIAPGGGPRNAPPLTSPRDSMVGRKASTDWIPWWSPPAAMAMLGLAALGWGIVRSRMANHHYPPLALTSNLPIAKPELWSEPLALALHTGVAERPALIAASLVERLESAPSSRQEVATLMLELEPWAASRILAVLPNRSLDVLEQAIRQPATAVSPQQVRALAEAMISLRAAA